MTNHHKKASAEIINGTHLTIEDGGQLVHGNAGLAATVKKAITGVGVNAWLTASNGWCIIASPIVSDLAISSFPLGQYYDVFKELNAARPEQDRYKIAAIFSYGVNEDMDGKGDEVLRAVAV